MSSPPKAIPIQSARKGVRRREGRGGWFMNRNGSRAERSAQAMEEDPIRLNQNSDPSIPRSVRPMGAWSPNSAIE